MSAADPDIRSTQDETHEACFRPMRRLTRIMSTEPFFIPSSFAFLSRFQFTVVNKKFELLLRSRFFLTLFVCASDRGKAESTCIMQQGNYKRPPHRIPLIKD